MKRKVTKIIRNPKRNQRTPKNHDLKNQMNIFNYFEPEEDPVFQKLENLKKEASTRIGEFTVCLNGSGIYEITSDEVHEGCASIERVYNFIQEHETEKLRRLHDGN